MKVLIMVGLLAAMLVGGLIGDRIGVSMGHISIADRVQWDERVGAASTWPCIPPQMIREAMQNGFPIPASIKDKPMCELTLGERLNGASTPTPQTHQ